MTPKPGDDPRVWDLVRKVRDLVDNETGDEILARASLVHVIAMSLADQSMSMMQACQAAEAVQAGLKQAVILHFRRKATVPRPSRPKKLRSPIE